MKRKHFFWASVCIFLMVCLGSCEDPTSENTDGGSNNDNGSSSSGGSVDELPVGTYAGEINFGSYDKEAVEIEIVSNNAIIYAIEEGKEYTLTPYDGDGFGSYHPDEIDSEASYFQYEGDAFGGVGIGIKKSSEDSILIVHLVDMESSSSSREMKSSIILKEKVPPKLTLKERAGLYSVHLSGMNMIRFEFDAAGSIEYIQGMNIFEGTFTVDDLAKETGVGNSHQVQVTSTQNNVTKMTLTIEFISDNQLSLRIGAQQELQTLTKQ